MKRKGFLTSVGGICFTLVLTILLLLGACNGPAGITSTTAPANTTTQHEPQESTEPAVTITQQGTQEPTVTIPPNPEVQTLTCDELINIFQKPGVAITSSTLVSANGTIPEHCDVRGTICNSISFAVELPINWNGRFYMVGNGGFAGSISYTAMETGLIMGYATASTDTGHDSNVSPLASFAYNNRTAEIDYCFRAVHLTALVAKEIIETYYGEPPSYSYFIGCSCGGWQGMTEAQLFPMDFDGIVAGAPGFSFTGHLIAGIWNAMALSGQGNIPVEKIRILADAVYKKCDGVDGLVDGIINNPLDCTFDPVTDLPPGSFTPAQVEALKKIYGGPKNSKGELIYPGLSIGSEVFANGLSGWQLWVIASSIPNIQITFSESFMQYLAFEIDPGPDYDWTTFNFDTDPPRMAYMSSILNANNPDLSAFKVRGGKMIHYHGWADTALNPLMSIKYYEDVLDLMGVEATMDFYRLYMVPGMFHCAGGAGCNTVDWFTPLVDWVENGIAPEGLIGSHIEGGKVVRTRPLYPYPAVAVYSGNGSIDDAVNFVSSADLDCTTCK